MEFQLDKKLAAFGELRLRLAHIYICTQQRQKHRVENWIPKEVAAEN